MFDRIMIMVIAFLCSLAFSYLASQVTDPVGDAVCILLAGATGVVWGRMAALLVIDRRRQRD